MSTRAQIIIENQPIFLYKHCDGYPEGVLPVLEPFIKHFFAERRHHDPQYFMARLVMAFRDAERDHLAEELAELKQPDAQPDEWSLKYYSTVPVTGFGLDCEIHGDIRYLYMVSKTGEIKIVEGDALRDLQNLQDQVGYGNASKKHALSSFVNDD